LFYPAVGKGKIARLDFVLAGKQRTKGVGGSDNITADVSIQAHYSGTDSIWN